MESQYVFYNDAGVLAVMTKNGGTQTSIFNGVIN